MANTLHSKVPRRACDALGLASESVQHLSPALETTCTTARARFTAVPILALCLPLTALLVLIELFAIAIPFWIVNVKQFIPKTHTWLSFQAVLARFQWHS